MYLVVLLDEDDARHALAPSPEPRLATRPLGRHVIAAGLVLPQQVIEERPSAHRLTHTFAARRPAAHVWTGRLLVVFGGAAGEDRARGFQQGRPAGAAVSVGLLLLLLSLPLHFNRVEYLLILLRDLAHLIHLDEQVLPADLRGLGLGAVLLALLPLRPMVRRREPHPHVDLILNLLGRTEVEDRAQLV